VQGEVPDVPLSIEGLLIPVSCIILENPLFDLLLGRAFMERLRGNTDWGSGQYTFHAHNRRIDIDAVNESRPRISKEEPSSSESVAIAEKEKGSEDACGMDEEAEKSDGSTDDDPDEEDEEEVDEEDDIVQTLILNATKSASQNPLQPISMEELLANEVQRQVASVFVLTHCPIAPDPSEEVLFLSIQAKESMEKVSDMTFKSNQYGF